MTHQVARQLMLQQHVASLHQPKEPEPKPPPEPPPEPPPASDPGAGASELSHEQRVAVELMQQELALLQQQDLKQGKQEAEAEASSASAAAAAAASSAGQAAMAAGASIASTAAAAALTAKAKAPVQPKVEAPAVRWKPATPAAVPTPAPKPEIVATPGPRPVAAEAIDETAFNRRMLAFRQYMELRIAAAGKEAKRTWKLPLRRPPLLVDDVLSHFGQVPPRCRPRARALVRSHACVYRYVRVHVRSGSCAALSRAPPAVPVRMARGSSPRRKLTQTITLSSSPS